MGSVLHLQGDWKAQRLCYLSDQGGSGHISGFLCEEEAWALAYFKKVAPGDSNVCPGLRVLALDKRSARFFSQEAGGKYFPLCGPYSLCRNYSVLSALTNSVSNI